MAAGLKRIAVVALGLLFLLAGANHFANTDFYTRMMPAWLPYHRGLVLLSGALEMIGGAAVLVTRLRKWAGWYLIVLLIAVFPANVNMALHPEDFSSVSSQTLYARLPLQAVLIAWVWWATRRDPSDEAESRH